MLNELLRARDLPALQPREKMLEILQREIYGVMPEAPESVSFVVEENVIPRYCASKAAIHHVSATSVIRGKSFTFPFTAVLPTDGRQHPFFIHINFRDSVPDRYMPTEELIDNGFAELLSVTRMCRRTTEISRTGLPEFCSRTGSAKTMIRARSRFGHGRRSVCLTGRSKERTCSI